MIGRSDNTRLPRVDTASPPQSVKFISGPYAGLTVQAELDEIQKAELGRRYARKDRRPLDPPPIARLRLFKALDEGLPSETTQEISGSDIVDNGLGLICYLDLFAVQQEDDGGNQISTEPATPKTATSFGSGPSLASAASSTLPQNDQPMPDYPYSSSSTSGSSIVSPVSDGTYSLPLRRSNSDHDTFLSPIDTFSPSTSSHGPAKHRAHQSDSTYPAKSSDVITYVGNIPVTTELCCTQYVFGSTFVQSICVDYEGKKTAMFVFSDIAIRYQGTFVLRYRIFDISSTTLGRADIPVLAECYGGVFRVYPTKDFPGLDASTDLTKQLAFYGLRLNSRDHERKRRKNERSQTAIGTAQQVAIAPALNTTTDEDGFAHDIQGVYGEM